MKELATALCKAQSELTNAIKDKKNPHFKSTYADLNSCWEACREPLTKNGLSIIQTLFITQDGKSALRTILMHNSGENISSEVILPVVKPGSQELGSCIKYMRRYSLAAIVGVTDGEDDDAEAAEGRRFDKSAQRPTTNTTYTTKEAHSAPAYDPEPHPMPPSNYAVSKYPLSVAQVNRMFAIARKSNWSPKFVNLYVKNKYNKTNENLTKAEYEAVCQYFADTTFNDDLEMKLEPNKPVEESKMEQFEKAKKSYVDHTAGRFDDSEKLPF